MSMSSERIFATIVAPVRERGLKCIVHCFIALPCECRSREGARIEMSVAWSCGRQMWCRSREGARIEIVTLSAFRSRISSVAPVRERGLKLQLACSSRVKIASLP